MTHRTDLLSLLRHYAASDDNQPWLAATVVTKHSSSYRKPGAMMLVDPLGRALGLISGGCLEADIVLQGKKVLFDGQARHLVYDSTEDGNMAAELGLGCNGRVGVLIQSLTPPLRDLLLVLRQRLEQGLDSHLLHCFASPRSSDLNTLILLDERLQPLQSGGDVPLPTLDRQTLDRQTPLRHSVLTADDRHWSLTVQRAPVNLWVIGGGVDAEPVVTMAAMLGWRVTVVDHRSAYGREQRFADAERILRTTAEEYSDPIDADAVVLMSHNLAMDAAWLAHCRRASRLGYAGLLGPPDRRDEVIALSGLDPAAPLHCPLHGPMGFDIGGEGPESIALSVLSQCHQVLASAGRL